MHPENSQDKRKLHFFLSFCFTDEQQASHTCTQEALHRMIEAIGQNNYLTKVDLQGKSGILWPEEQMQLMFNLLEGNFTIRRLTIAVNIS